MVEPKANIRHKTKKVPIKAITRNMKDLITETAFHVKTIAKTRASIGNTSEILFTT